MKTKIRPHILATLEEGNYTFLPPIYIISFVKTYSSFLKIPDDEIEEAVEYIRRLTKYEKPPEANYIQSNVTELEKQPFSFKNLKKRKLPKLPQANIVPYLLYIASGLALLTLMYFLLFMDDDNASSFQGDSGNKPDTALIKNQLEESEEVLDSLVLEARGLDTAWLRINIDGTQSEQLVVVPEFEKEWSAKKFIILSLGNAGAVEFKRDGKVLPPFGTKGSVIRNVKITKDQVVSSASPWNVQKDSTVKVVKKVVKKQPKPVEPPRMLEPSPAQNTLKPFEKKNNPK